MKLHQVPHEQIRAGDKVVSRRGRPGVITYAAQERHFAVSIQWSKDGSWKDEEQTESHFYLYGTEESDSRSVEYLGQ